MLPSADVKFNYEMLPTEKAASARAAAERIRGRMQLAAESIIEVGRELIEQKKALGHGNFLPWIESEFGMSQSSSDRLMQVAKTFGEKLPIVGNLGVTALYALAAPSTPEPVREAVLERAAGGEKVTAKEIEALKKKLARTEELAADKESQRAAQENRAAIAAKQAGDAANRAMFAEAAKERLAEQLVLANEEIERLREPGVIHQFSDPVSTFNENCVAPVSEPTSWTDDDAQTMLLQYAWEKASADARSRFLAWADLECGAAGYCSITTKTKNGA
jgi:hypothetical protein